MKIRIVLILLLLNGRFVCDGAVGRVIRPSAMLLYGVLVVVRRLCH